VKLVCLLRGPDPGDDARAPFADAVALDVAVLEELEPDWIVVLDGDERVPADDATALRAFLERDAVPGCAYLFDGDSTPRVFAYGAPHVASLRTTLRVVRDGEPEPRPQDLPVLAPLLSAIVISRDDERTIERTVCSVVEQEVPAPFEVIVVTSGTDRTAQIVRETFPSVRLVELDRPALPGAARNAGLRVAHGRYVTFPGSHVELPPGSLAARLRAHELGYPMVSHAIVNGTPTLAGWASHLLDQAGQLPGRPSGPIAGPPVACSYARELLLEVGGFREDVRAGEDTRVNDELARRGYRAYFSNEVRVIHVNPCRNAVRLLRHKFLRGRALGQLLVEAGASPRAALRGYVRWRVSNATRNVDRWGGDLRRTYRLVFPLVVAGAVAVWAGAWFEVLRRRA
jgi:glycosyltransferase involved in cell wall biosynthesis